MYTNLPFNKMMVVRTILFFIAWLNQFLVANGNSPLPFDDAQTEFVVTSLITFAVSMWAWYKNNDLTRKARLAAKANSKVIKK